MNEQAELQIEAACRRLLMRLAVAVDRNDHSMLLSAFSEDAVWRRPDQAPMIGHAKIRRFLELLLAKRTSLEFPNGHLHRHLMTTVHVEVLDDTQARGTAYALVFRESEPRILPAMIRTPELLVQYDDVFRLIPGTGWRIAEHQAQHVFRSDNYGTTLTPAEALAIA